MNSNLTAKFLVPILILIALFGVAFGMLYQNRTPVAVPPSPPPAPEAATSEQLEEIHPLTLAQPYELVAETGARVKGERVELTEPPFEPFIAHMSKSIIEGVKQYGNCGAIIDAPIQWPVESDSCEVVQTDQFTIVSLIGAEATHESLPRIGSMIWLYDGYSVYAFPGLVDGVNTELDAAKDAWETERDKPTYEFPDETWQELSKFLSQKQQELLAGPEIAVLQAEQVRRIRTSLSGLGSVYTNAFKDGFIYRDPAGAFTFRYPTNVTISRQDGKKEVRVEARSIQVPYTHLTLFETSEAAGGDPFPVMQIFIEPGEVKFQEWEGLRYPDFEQVVSSFEMTAKE